MGMERRAISEINLGHDDGWGMCMEERKGGEESRMTLACFWHVQLVGGDVPYSTRGHLG